MKGFRLLFVLSCFFSVAVTRASAAVVTNFVDIAALAACCPEDTQVPYMTNGWEVCGIDSYQDTSASNPANIHFDSNDDYVISTNFNAAVTAIVVKAHSSSQSGRRLVFEPLVDGEFLLGSAAVCGYTDSSRRYDWQMLCFAPGVRTRCFRIRFELVEGATTGWGVSALGVLTDDEAVEPAEGLAVVKTNATSVVLTWRNCGRTSGNSVSVYRYAGAGIGEKVENVWDFSFLPYRNSTMPAVEDVAAVYPELLSSFVYAAAHTNGILQIGSGVRPGGILVPVSGDAAGKVLRLVLKRYVNGDTVDGGTMPVGYVLEGVTNLLASIELNRDEFVQAEVPLDGLPAGAMILLNGPHETSSNKRVHIRSFSLVDTEAELFERIFERTLPVASSQAEIPVVRIKGLAPYTQYDFEVYSFDSSGVSVGPVCSQVVRTLSRKGTQLVLR